ncbi:hypothetical protein RhiirB3_430821 [Rhizophagus irregularis]|nr:hypothetical protein RhiirB3_430821 [Rhizophagus irregularis]
MSPKIRKEAIYRPTNKWTISWDLSQQQEFYGKTIEQHNDVYGTSLTYRTHYIPALDADTRTNLTPKKLTPTLRPCPGNCGHVVPFHNDLRPKCVLVSLTPHLIIFKTHGKKYIPPHFRDKIHKSLIFTIKPLHTLRLLALTITKHRLIVPNVLPSHVSILSSLDSYINTNRDFFVNPLNLNLDISSPFFIKNLFLGSYDSILDLFEISKYFLLQTNFSFYTDGSFSRLDESSSSPTQMGFAWVEISNSTPSSNIPPPSFKGALSFNPSSTKAEIYALLTTIIAVLNNSVIEVFTDSLNMIQTFHKITNKSTSIRQKLKCKNHIAWRLIDTLIEKKGLTLRLHKVKAHSNDFWNDMADDLANMARQLSPIEINPTHLPGSLMTPLWASIAPIDRDIRKFGHNITDTYTFDQLLGNKGLSPIFNRFSISSIHWPLTQLWLHHNSTSDICSSTKSSYDAFKIKAFNHILPCGDVLIKHYPDLYPNQDIPCPFCSNQADSNEHLGLCTNLFPIINKTLQAHKLILQELIEKHTDYDITFITSAINQFDLLKPLTSDNSSHHPIYLIIHQLIPQDLYNLTRSFTFNDKISRKIIWEFLLSFHEDIYSQIWPKHCSLLRAWERRNGITTRQKRNAKQNTIRRRRHQLSANPPPNGTISSPLPPTRALPHNHRRTNVIPPDGSPRPYVHPWFTTPPTNRPLSSPQLPMWLILCTCNFLHSGGWLCFIRHPTQLELNLDNFSSTCNFNFNFFSSSFSLPVFSTT